VEMYLGMFVLDFVESYTHGLVHCFCFYIEHIYYVENTTKLGEFSWLFGVTIGHNVHHLAWSHIIPATYFIAYIWLWQDGSPESLSHSDKLYIFFHASRTLKIENTKVSLLPEQLSR